MNPVESSATVAPCGRWVLTGLLRLVTLLRVRSGWFRYPNIEKVVLFQGGEDILALYLGDLRQGSQPGTQYGKPNIGATKSGWRAPGLRSQLDR